MKCSSTQVEVFIPPEALFHLFPKAKHRSRESRELNVKMLFGSNDFQTWCHAAVIFFSPEKHRLTSKVEKCEGRETKSVMWSVCMSELLFHFKSALLTNTEAWFEHVWKINLWHLQQSLAVKSTIWQAALNMAGSKGFHSDLNCPNAPHLYIYIVTHNFKNITNRELFIFSLIIISNHNVLYHDYFCKKYAYRCVANIHQ